MRVFKTRALAAAACRAGQVTVAGNLAKASRKVRPGETVLVRRPMIELQLRVLMPIEKRVGAKEVPECMEDLTPQEARDHAAKVAAERRAARQAYGERGEGRPSKRQRRQIEAFLDEVERGRDAGG